jgi:hypothetical protein
MTSKQATNWTLQGEAIDEGLHVATELDDWVSGPTVLGKYKHKVASRVKRAFRKQSELDRIEIGGTYICKKDRGHLSLVTVTAKNEEIVTVRPLSSSSSSVLGGTSNIRTDIFLNAYGLYDDAEGLMSL